MQDKKPAAFRSVLNPKTPVLVSCRGKDGKNNALAVVYACNCSYDPPMIMVGIVPSRYSYGIIKETGVFIANLVPTSMTEGSCGAGRASVLSEPVPCLEISYRNL